MKKQIILLSIIMTLGSTGVFSQLLSNSTWIVYNSTSTFFSYFHFGTDTLSVSIDNISYSNVSTYQENINDFTIIDLPTAPCPTDTGHYTFLIQNDTLKFTLVSDNCDTRPTTLSIFNWVRLYTGMQEIDLAASINMYPNPTIGLLTIPIDGEKNIIVTNLQGQIVKTIKTDTKTISLTGLGAGNYIVSVYNNNKLLTTRQIVYEK